MRGIREGYSGGVRGCEVRGKGRGIREAYEGGVREGGGV